MSDAPEPDDLGEDKMQHREITLPDGRYMIFYTFDDEGRCEDTNDQGEDV